MKQIKAFIRNTRAEEVVRALEDARAPGITVSPVHGVGYGYDPMLFTLSPSELAKIPRIVKLEVVCGDADLERLIEVIRHSAFTGYRGDGIVFVTPVEAAVKIRTGEVGPQALK